MKQTSKERFSQIFFASSLIIIFNNNYKTHFKILMDLIIIIVIEHIFVITNCLHNLAFTLAIMMSHIHQNCGDVGYMDYPQTC